MCGNSPVYRPRYIHGINTYSSHFYSIFITFPCSLLPRTSLDMRKGLLRVFGGVWSIPFLKIPLCGPGSSDESSDESSLLESVSNM